MLFRSAGELIEVPVPIFSVVMVVTPLVALTLPTKVGAVILVAVIVTPVPTVIELATEIVLIPEILLKLIIAIYLFSLFWTIYQTTTQTPSIVKVP